MTRQHHNNPNPRAAPGACDTSESDPPTDKGDVRGMQEEADLDTSDTGKADGFDFCDYHGFYGDGECDTWCPQPDPDCTHDQLYLTLGGVMVDFADGTPLAGGQVCGSDSCGAIAADGSYTLEIRKNRVVDVTTSKDGYVPALLTFRTGAEDIRYTNKLPTAALFGLLAQLYLGVPSPDPAKGALVTNAYAWND